MRPTRYTSKNLMDAFDQCRYLHPTPPHSSYTKHVERLKNIMSSNVQPPPKRKCVSVERSVNNMQLPSVHRGTKRPPNKFRISTRL